MKRCVICRRIPLKDEKTTSLFIEYCGIRITNLFHWKCYLHNRLAWDKKGWKKVENNTGNEK